MKNSVLPKQWHQWAKKAGLKLSYPRSEEGYLEGHNRYWRVDCVNCFDMSETFDTFDRWANSTEATAPLDNINNEKDFVQLVQDMLAGAHKLDRDY